MKALELFTREYAGALNVALFFLALALGYVHSSRRR